MGFNDHLEYKKKIEFDLEQYKTLSKFSKENNISLFASCWDEISVEQMNEVSIPAYKLASASLQTKKQLMQ